MYNFNERLTKLISVDKIRVCKIMEIIQYSFIFLILILLSAKMLNYYYFSLFLYDNEIHKSNKKKNSIFYLFWMCLKDTIIIIILLFYLRKIALLFPSLPSLIVPSFKENTTIDLSIHIALVFIFLEFIPEYKKKIDELKDRVY
jgi:hypothetical protein